MSLSIWKKSLNDRRTTPLSDREWRKKVRILERFSEHIKKVHGKEFSPDELVKLEYEFIEDCISGFWDVIRKKASWNSATTFAATVQGFFTANRIRLKKGLVPRPKRTTETTHLYESVPVFRISDKGEYEGLSEVFIQWIDSLPEDVRVIAYCSFSSGADVADILQLTVGRVNASDEDRFYLTGDRMKAEKRKTSWPFKTFISKEATRMLRRYIRTYRKSAETSEPVFELSPKNVQDTFRTVAKRQGLMNGGKNPFTTKRLRHAFTTACTAFVKLPSDAVDILTGHVGSMSKSYVDKPKPIIASFYTEVERYVTVHGTGMPENIRQLVGEYEDKLIQRDSKIDSLEFEIEKIKNQMKQLAEALKGFIK